MLALLVIGLAGGCVKKSEYEALQAKTAAEQEELAGTLARERERGSSLEEQLKREQTKVAKLEEELGRLTKELAAARERQVELQDQLTEKIHDSSKLKASIQEMQTALVALREQKRQTEERIAEYKKLLSSFQALIDAGKLKVKVVAGRMIVELPSDVLFGSGSIELSEGGKTSVTEIGAILATMKDREFQVDGHTDDQRIRTARFPNNWWLASGRAISVADILIKAGLPPTRISAASFGEHRPVAPNSTPEGRAQNRRIEIVLVPDLSKVPGFEELERAAKN